MVLSKTSIIYKRMKNSYFETNNIIIIYCKILRKKDNNVTEKKNVIEY